MAPPTHMATVLMSLIRVHVGPMPRMLRAMINDLLKAEPDMAIVGNSFADEDSLCEASAQSADVLIARDTASEPGTCTAAMLSGSPSAILAVAVDGHDGTCVNLVRRAINLNAEGSSLPDAIRELLSRSVSYGLIQPSEG
jgi:hypothetical protein